MDVWRELIFNPDYCPVLFLSRWPQRCAPEHWEAPRADSCGFGEILVDLVEKLLPQEGGGALGWGSREISILWGFTTISSR